MQFFIFNIKQKDKMILSILSLSLTFQFYNQIFNLDLTKVQIYNIQNKKLEQQIYKNLNLEIKLKNKKYKYYKID
jgi:hypothetical protein